VRIAHAMLIAALAWGVFAFGGAYAWAYWPLVAAAFAIAALAVVAERASPVARPAERWLAVGFGAFAAAAVGQLIPLPSCSRPHPKRCARSSS
jgi:hypothetical protein